MGNLIVGTHTKMAVGSHCTKLADSQVRTVVERVLTFFLWDEDWLTSSLLSESSDIWLEGALGSSHGTGASHVGVVTSLEVKLAREVGADWLGSSFESKSTCCWSKVWWILTLIALWLLWNVLLFWNQVVNALVKIDHL